MKKGCVCYFCTENQLVQMVLTGVLGLNFFKHLKMQLVMIVCYMKSVFQKKKFQNFFNTYQHLWIYQIIPFTQNGFLQGKYI